MTQQQKLTGKVAIVTGASKGLGAGIPEEQAAQGASVAVNYASSKEDADRVVSEIVKAGFGLFFQRKRARRGKVFAAALAHHEDGRANPPC
jgi:NAD(P)-dependent dehydrogenase (short-subunit alcohol dehydrogenase family)